MFKNVIIYTMNKGYNITNDGLAESLPKLKFTSCGPQDFQKTGFVSHQKGYEELFYSANGQTLVNIMKEEKILPAAVINDILNDKIEKYEEMHGSKPKKQMKDQLKDEVVQELLPRAFSKFSKTPVWIDNKNKLIIVETSSESKAEDALAVLRKALGSLPVRPLTSKSAPELTLTEWVKKGKAFEGLTILDEVEMKAVLEEGGVITSKKQDLMSDEIQNHLNSGKLVTKLSLQFNENLTFTITDKLTIKKVKMLDVVKDSADKDPNEDESTKFDADFVLYTGEVGELIQCIISAFECNETDEIDEE